MLCGYSNLQLHVLLPNPGVARARGESGLDLAGTLSVQSQSSTRHRGPGRWSAGHGGRVDMAQDLVKEGVDLPALMTTGRWKNSTMQTHDTELQPAGWGAVVTYFREGGR